MRQILDDNEVSLRIDELGGELVEELRRLGGDSKEPVVVIGVLSGGVFFLADLLRVMSLDMVLGWAIARSYQGEVKVVEGPPEVELVLDWNCSIEGRRILIVDDIIDEGDTLSAVVDVVSELSPASITTVTLLRKLRPRKIDPSFSGFNIQDRQFVVGSGMDKDGLYRDLPGIWTL